MGNVSLRNEIKMLMGKKTKIALGVAIVAAVVGLTAFFLDPLGLAPLDFEDQLKEAKQILADHGILESRLSYGRAGKTSFFDFLKQIITFQLVVDDSSNLKLNLRKTQVKDLSPLKELKLYGVVLAQTHVADLGPLKELTYLLYLDLSKTQVTDLSPLKQLTKLNVLNLSNTPVTDLSPLKELTNLQGLYLAQTQVTDLSPLKGLTKLEYLDLSYTQVADSEIEELQKAIPKLRIIR